MVHDVLQHLPEGLRLRVTTRGLVRYDLLQIVLAERGDVVHQALIDCREAGPQGLEIWKRRGSG